jgi:hypothetical protein
VKQPGNGLSRNRHSSEERTEAWLSSTKQPKQRKFATKLISAVSEWVRNDFRQSSFFAKYFTIADEKHFCLVLGK